MNHEIYIFGSIIRGEVSATSDVDVLVIPLAGQSRDCYPLAWSVYSEELITSYYRIGRLFAWHLHLESRSIYSPSAENLLQRLGPPAPYSTAKQDIDDLEVILNEALEEIRRGTNSLVYEIGIIHTALRDIAMSASWKLLGTPNFSRESPYFLPTVCPLPIEVYRATMRARHCSTRGIMAGIDLDTVASAVLNTPLRTWTELIRRQL